MSVYQISVIVSVYNAEKYLKETIESILNQTFSDFEFIIINDASTDNSLNIIQGYDDNRIKLINKDYNKGFIGFVENLNLGLDQAKGKYIARIDSDDIARIDRFQLQYDFLENNPDIFIIGSDLQLINEDGNEIGYLKAKSSHREIKYRLNLENALYHPVIFFRNDSSIRYRDKFIACEDFDFYLQLLSEGKKFANINEPLLKYRILDNSLSRSDINLEKKILMELAKDFYVERIKKGKDNYNDLSNLEIKNLFKKNINSSRNLLIYGLKVAIILNSDYYSFLLEKFMKFENKKYRLVLGLFNSKLIRKYSSLVLLKYYSKFGKITRVD